MGVVVMAMAFLVGSKTSQTQPDPKILPPLSRYSAMAASPDPKAAPRASLSSPVGSVGLGVREFQNKSWLKWPPP